MSRRGRGDKVSEISQQHHIQIWYICWHFSLLTVCPAEHHKYVHLFAFHSLSRVSYIYICWHFSQYVQQQHTFVSRFTFHLSLTCSTTNCPNLIFSSFLMLARVEEHCGLVSANWISLWAHSLLKLMFLRWRILTRQDKQTKVHCCETLTVRAPTREFAFWPTSTMWLDLRSGQIWALQLRLLSSVIHGCKLSTSTQAYIYNTY